MGCPKASWRDRVRSSTFRSMFLGTGQAGRTRRLRGISAIPPRWIAIALGGTLGGLAAVQPLLGLSVVAAGVVAGIFLWNPVAGLAALISSRSSLDLFQDATHEQRAFLFNPASFLGILLIGLALILLALRTRNRRPIEWGGRVSLAWGGWIVFSALGVLIALLQLGRPGFNAAVREYIRLASIFAVYFLVINLAKSKRSRQFMISGLLLGLILPTVASVWQFVSKDTTHSVDGVIRIYGTFVHPGSFGVYLTALTMLCLGLWQDSWGGKVGRFWVGFALVISVVLTVFTATRAAWGILLAALLVRASMLPRRKRLVTLGAVFVASIALAPFVAWRFQDLLQGGDPSAERTNSFLWRLLNFQQLLRVFAQSPIVGHGLRATGFVNPITTSTAEGYERGFAAHSELIRVLVEQGILGLIAYIFMAVLLVSSIKQMSFSRPDDTRVELPGVGRSLYSLLAAAFVLAPIGAELLGGTAFLYVIFTTLGVLYSCRIQPSLETSHTGTPASSRSTP